MHDESGYIKTSEITRVQATMSLMHVDIDQLLISSVYAVDRSSDTT